MKLKTKISISKPTAIAVAIAVFGLVIGFGGYMMAVSPEKAKIVGINSQIQGARTSLITAEQAPRKVKPIPAKASDLFRLSVAMPDTDDIPGLLIAIGELAKTSTVKIVSVTPTADVPSTGFSSIPLTVDVTGTYPTVLRFLTAMRNSAAVNGDSIQVHGRLFVPTGVTVASTAGNQISASISVDAFSYLAPAPVAPTTTDGSTTTSAPTTPAPSA